MTQNKFLDLEIKYQNLKVACTNYELILISKGCSCKTCEHFGWCGQTYQKEVGSPELKVCHNWRAKNEFKGN